MLFALAGTMTLLSVALAVFASPWFLLLTAFVGVNQWLYVTVGDCPASLVLSRCVGLAAAVSHGDRRRPDRAHGPLDGDALPRSSSSPGS